MSQKPKQDEITAANKAAWNMSAIHHKNTDEWHRLCKRIAEPGFSTLDPTLTGILKNAQIDGKSAVQIGCNNGRETFSLAAFGAQRCVGIDQSEAFLEQAMELANIAGSDAEFICTDIYNLPPGTRKDFDLALVTIGVLNWMPDLPRFFKVVAGLLKPNAKLVIYETHPFLEMLDPTSETPYLPATSYFESEPFVGEEIIVYDGAKREGGATSYWFMHTLGHVLTSCIKGGFTINGVTEYPHSNRETDYDIYENQSAQFPMCYVLEATKET